MEAAAPSTGPAPLGPPLVVGVTSWWACARDHEANLPVRACLAHGYDEPSAHVVALRLIAEGHCPACPDEALTATQVALYGRATTWGRCGSDWRAGGSGASLEWESRPGPAMVQR